MGVDDESDVGEAIDRLRRMNRDVKQQDADAAFVFSELSRLQAENKKLPKRPETDDEILRDRGDAWDLAEVLHAHLDAVFLTRIGRGREIISHSELRALVHSDVVPECVKAVDAYVARLAGSGSWEATE